MDKKILAIAAVVVIVVAGAGAYLALGMNNSSDKELNLLARVNTEGSGISLIPSENPEDYMTESNTKVTSDDVYCVEDLTRPGTYLVFHKEAWGGKVFGTPGITAIQQIQLQDFVTNGLGLEYTKYIAGSTLNKNTVYFDEGISSYEKYKTTVENFNTNKEPLVGSIIWEAQYSLALKNGYNALVTTNQLFPDHTCCVIAGTHSYTSTHTEETVRFLAAYVESVNKMKSVIATGSGAEYDHLIDVAIKSVAFPDGISDDMKVDVIKSAFELVTYKYDDGNATDPLVKLKADIADLAQSLYDSDNLKKTPEELGFDSYKDLANKFVDSSYLKDALNYEKTGDEAQFNITVAVIAGDIHQFAIHYGMDQGIFKDYGVNITLSMQTYGGGVTVALENGGANFGFVGAPPITIKTIDNKYITA